MKSYWELVKRIWRAPGNRGRRLRVLLRSVLWLVNKKTRRRPWTLAVYDDMKLRCYPDSIIALHVVQRGEFHDWDTAKFITEFLREGDTFVDVGANIGLYTLPAAAKKARVVAVEPSARNRGRLEENLALNGLTSVKIEACALGETEGEMAFCDDDALAHVELAGNGPKVPVRRLDAILPEGEIVLLKVDVEGFELAVFQGAEIAMRAGRLPVILFEMNHSYERYGVTEAQIFGFLREHGYLIARYEHDARRLVTHGLEGDVVAFTPGGEQLIHDRLLS
ncbi:MAG: FkbM family methyltransferase [Verrucomicrobiaceae bacterium]|nr:FkbM family methyltransferase [Verrucomicrobiaceae bacterium]